MKKAATQSTAHERLVAALAALGPKPSDDAAQSEKKRFSERVSSEAALAIAAELRARGLAEALPARPEPVDGDDNGASGGAERRMAGGIGAKKVDVTWATEECGLILAFSVKSINFKDKKTGNFQKNLANRRGDMLFEGVTLHRRFPYAVLVGLFFFDQGAAKDGTERRHSTMVNAHGRLKLFTGRDDPAGRDEQYERLYVALLGPSSVEFSLAGAPGKSVRLDDILDDVMKLVAERNPDFYETDAGSLRRVPG